MFAQIIAFAEGAGSEAKGRCRVLGMKENQPGEMGIPCPVLRRGWGEGSLLVQPLTNSQHSIHIGFPPPLAFPISTLWRQECVWGGGGGGVADRSLQRDVNEAVTLTQLFPQQHPLACVHPSSHIPQGRGQHYRE